MSVQPETASVAVFCCLYGFRRCCQLVHKVGCYVYESALNYWALVHNPAEKLTITHQKPVISPAQDLWSPAQSITLCKLAQLLLLRGLQH